MKKGVIITGVGKGIGKSILKFFLDKDIFVYGVTRSPSDISKLKGLRNCKIFLSDVRDLNTFKTIIKESKQKKIQINGLINNAGIRQRIPFRKISKENLNEIFQINFFSIFQTMQVYSNYCIKNKINSSIVNIGSIVGSLGFSGLCGYSSTKGALNSLTKSFASEHARFNIRANVIEPGFTKTSYFKKFKKKKLYKWTLSRIPMRRWGNSLEIAKLVYFLYSSDSSYINGEAIAIDGGWKNS